MFKRLKNLFKTEPPTAQPEETFPPARIPDDTCLYAVGDVHGRLDLLRQMQALILQDAAALPEQTRRIVVYLGDYIDRGDASKGVVDLLLNAPLPGFETIHLKGNHESAMADFLTNPTPGHLWTVYGGLSTVVSYGIRMPNTHHPSSETYAYTLRDKLMEALPAEHTTFYSGLRIRFQIGDYFFVHAGIRPGVALAAQDPNDLLWIREPFLNDRQKHEHVIVHGHTDTKEPVMAGNRIGIDTGAYYSGRLTCLVLAGETQKFLSTGMILPQ